MGLFVELVLIRWLGAQVRPLAHVKNLVLIGCFLGLGLGFALAKRRRSTYPLAVILLSATLLLGTFLGLPDGIGFTGPAGPELNLGVKVASSATEVVDFFLTIGAVFAMVVLTTVPLGQIAGEYMEGLRSLHAYTVNVAGALAGILIFFILGAFSLPPWIWAAIALGILLLYLGPPWWLRLASTAVAVVACVAMARADTGTDGRTLWSPYNKIEIHRMEEVRTPDGESHDPGWVLRVQNLYYQRLLDLTPEKEEVSQYGIARWREAFYAYNFPYTLDKPAHVLVVGAGAGNDVAAALRAGVEKITAVEIDPLIIDFGRSLHPEQPYSDPRVTLIEDDARAFLRKSTDHFDMIVFGLLDAQTSLFSTLSGNIRLDNFVYTVEAFEQALARLKPQGILVVAFYAEQPWIATRLEAMIRQAAGHAPLSTLLFYDQGVLLVAGPGTPSPSERPDLSVGVPPEALGAAPGPLATDDWPFLYLADRQIPPTVVQASVGMLLVTVVLVLLLFPGKIRFDRHFFFLGAGFLLVETRTIAQLGLLFGTTWRVSAITIGSILILILLANLVVARWGSIPRPILYLGLASSLVANWIVPASAALGGGSIAIASMAAFFLLPLFFAGLIFATSVRATESLSTVLASNLVGAVLGGLLENTSMLVGIPALSLVALVVYAASLRK
ncbi:MAG: hypothetical protein O7H41_04495 [Planctomycetota bacterium]|nr:hypothetical protein [Planctomycetota bacterium]